MTRWHSTSSGKTNLEQTGHFIPVNQLTVSANVIKSLVPLKEINCTGNEWAENTLPNDRLSSVEVSESGEAERPKLEWICGT